MGSPPTPTAYQSPSGRKLGDGHRTTITFASNPTIALWPLSITPPSVEGMAPNETTTQDNVTWRTFHPRRLKTLGALSFSCMYDPKVYPQLVNQVNVQDVATVHFPDGSSLALYAFLQDFKPGPLEDGKRPEASCTLTPTNSDPSDCSEQPPVYSAGAGTSCY